MSVRFSANNSEIRFNIPAAVDLTGAYTLAVVTRLRAIGQWNALLTHHTPANQAILSMEVSDSNILDISTQSAGGGVSAINLGADAGASWWLLAITKASGTATPRGHAKNISTGAAWIHSNGSGTLPNSTSALGGYISYGEWQDTDDLNANLAVGGGWNVALSDPQIEALLTNLRTSDWVNHAVAPKYVHEFQTNTDILDLMGNGATLIVVNGTTVEAIDPPGWVYDGFSPTGLETFPVSKVPRGVIAIGASAWTLVDTVAEAPNWDFAVFHSPSVSQDIIDRDEFLAGNPTGRTYAYQNWAFSAEDSSWVTCGFTTAQAQAGGWTALFSGVEATVDGVQRGLDHGKDGFGLAWANNVITRMDANPGWHGVFFDDVNVADGRLPNNGIPDGYASATAYKDAIKEQLQIALAEVVAAGYYTFANVGGIHDGWQAPWQDNNIDLVGYADWSLFEFSGTWANGTTQYNPASGDKDYVQQIIRTTATLAQSRGRGIMINTYGDSQLEARYGDFWARIVGEPGYTAVGFEFDNTYNGPFPYFKPPMRSTFPHVVAAAPTHTDEAATWSRALLNGAVIGIDSQTLASTPTLSTTAGTMGAGLMGAAAANMGPTFGSMVTSQNGAATIAATSSVSANAMVERRAAATIVAASTTSLNSRAEHNAAATIAAVSGGTANARKEANGQSTIPAISSTTLAGFAEHRASATIPGQSSTSLTGYAGHNAAATIVGQSNVSATGTVAGIQLGQAQIDATSSVSATAKVEANASATIAAASNITAAAENSVLGAATIAAASNVTANGMANRNGAATIASTSNVPATARKEANASVTIAAISGGTATARIEHNALATIGSQSAVTAAGVGERRGAATISAQSDVIAESHTSGVQTGLATIDAQSSVMANSSVVHNAAATIAAQSSTTIAGFVERRGAAIIAAVSGGTATPRVEHNATATIVAGSTTSISSSKQANGGTIIPGQSAVSALANRDANAAAIIGATSTMFGTGLSEQNAAATIEAISNVIATAARDANASAIINATSDVIAQPPGNPVNGYAILRSWSTVKATVGQNRLGAIRIPGRSNVIASGTVVGVQAHISATSNLIGTGTIFSAVSRVPRRVYPGRTGVRGSRVRGGVR